MPPDRPAPTSSRWWLWAAGGGLVFLCVLAAAAWLVFLKPGQKNNPALPVVATGVPTASLPQATATAPSTQVPAATVIPAIIPTLTASPTPTFTITPTPSQVTVLWDISHGPRISSDGSPYTPDGLYRSLVQALASQKLVFSSGGLAGIDSSSILVLAAPSANQMAYSSGEADKIEQFVRVGWPQSFDPE